MPLSNKGLEMNTPLLSVKNLVVTYGSKKNAVQAVAGVSFDVMEGETLGLVGESGCGKSTTGRAILKLERASSGSVLFDGEALTSLSPGEMRTRRRKLQMLFQDPISSLNPRRKIKNIVAEPLIIWGESDEAKRDALVGEMLLEVGIDPALAGDRYPREFSGGQCQRISIARSLVANPRLLVCDEMVSALDVSVQAQIINLLTELKKKYNLTLLFIAHDLAVVKNVSDRVAVMYLGKVVEVASAESIYRDPRHAYTKALLSAIPSHDPTARRERILLEGDVPSPIDPPEGSAFGHRINHPRCAETIGLDLGLRKIAPGHQVAADPCCISDEDWGKIRQDELPREGES
jgi:oligopeptide/dipeptide ABC transporter ATP-binding protein